MALSIFWRARPVHELALAADEYFICRAGCFCLCCRAFARINRDGPFWFAVLDMHDRSEDAS